MTENLSEKIFKPQYDYPETSSLINRLDSSDGSSISPFDGEVDSKWYRIINPILWYWRGLPKLEIEAVLSRIAISLSAILMINGWIQLLVINLATGYMSF